MNIIAYWTNMLMIAQAMAFLAHFGFIVKYGQVLIQEPNPLILYAEITGLVAIIAFGVRNLVVMIKRYRT